MFNRSSKELVPYDDVIEAVYEDVEPQENEAQYYAPTPDRPDRDLPAIRKSEGGDSYSRRTKRHTKTVTTEDVFENEHSTKRPTNILEDLVKIFVTTLAFITAGLFFYFLYVR